MTSRILNSEDIDLVKKYLSRFRKFDNIEFLPFDNINIDGNSIPCELIVIYDHMSLSIKDIRHGIVFKYNDNLYGDELSLGADITNFEKGIYDIKRQTNHTFINKFNDKVVLLLNFYIEQLKTQGTKETLLEYINNNVGEVLTFILLKSLTSDEVCTKFAKINKLLNIKKKYKNIFDVAKDIVQIELDITKSITIDKEFFNLTFNYYTMGKKTKNEKVSRGEIKVSYDQKNQGELAERATQEEKEIIVAEVEHFEKCCEPTEECPTPSEGCCVECECPPTTCEKSAELKAKYKELDDDFDNVLEENKCFSIAGCPICWKHIVVIAFLLLLLAKRAL